MGSMKGVPLLNSTKEKAELNVSVLLNRSIKINLKSFFIDYFSNRESNNSNNTISKYAKHEPNLKSASSSSFTNDAMVSDH